MEVELDVRLLYILRVCVRAVLKNMFRLRQSSMPHNGSKRNILMRITIINTICRNLSPINGMGNTLASVVQGSQGSENGTYALTIGLRDLGAREWVSLWYKMFI